MPQKKKFLILAFISLLFSIFFLSLFFVFMNKETQSERNNDNNPKVCFSQEEEDFCINVELAKTPKEKVRGLMYRESLGENEGMLFMYEKEGYRAFWMRNMNFPLDIIWLDSDRIIIYIHENIPPCTSEHCPLYSPSDGKKAQYILEVNAHFSRRNNLSIGQKLTFRNL
jgi:hypothetical protein